MWVKVKPNRALAIFLHTGDLGFINGITEGKLQDLNSDVELIFQSIFDSRQRRAFRRELFMVTESTLNRFIEATCEIEAAVDESVVNEIVLGFEERIDSALDSASNELKRALIEEVNEALNIIN